jgi:murein L,D-transpeptidase YcbB/YkuD
VLENIEENFVLVNIAGFTAYVVKNREIVWSTEVQVGKTYHQTPVFRLRDTPSKALFEKAERTFSHGCIRVKNPVNLAEVLLAPDGWDRQKLDATLASRETKTVFLSQRLPVLLLYWTAAVDPQGIVHFYNDPYERDRRSADALDAPFRLELPGS